MTRSITKNHFIAYSKGITASREIAWCCTNNIIFMALSCQVSPHFTTIANFISSHSQATEILFEQVLLICDEIPTRSPY
ncbi:Mobile element protein [uncultured Candidatus Thioglobus sp.]|nr:Mobile element protein [uncultured Candidatus Thioglobus sp.]